MTDIRLTESAVDVSAWASDARARYVQHFRDVGEPTESGAVALADAFVGEWVQADQLTPTMTLLQASGAARGTLLVAENVDRGTPTLRVLDVNVDVDEGSASLVHDALVAEATARGEPRCSMIVPGGHPNVSDVARGGPHTLVATRMMMPLPGAAPSAPAVALAPMTAAELTMFYDHLVESYAADMAAAGAVDPDEAHAHSVAQISALLPDGRTTSGHHLMTARDGERVGVLWLYVGAYPGGTRAYVYDVEVTEAHRGRGYGRAIMEGASTIATREGASTIGLNVFGFNDVAIGLYRSMGYRVEFEMVTLHS